MSRRIVFFIFSLGLIALIAWAALKPSAPAADKAGAGGKPQVVSTAISVAQDVPLRLEAQGTVVPLNTVDLRPQITSTVQQVHIREGQDVAKGQLLFTLDTRSDNAKVEQSGADLSQTKAQLADAERNLNRAKELLQQHFVSQSAVDTAQSTVDSLRAALGAKQATLSASKVGLSYQMVHAPFAGRVGGIDVHNGALVQPGGSPLVTVTQLDPIAVSFTLPERQLPKLLAAQQSGDAPATMTLDPKTTLTGKLSFVDNAVDTASGSIKVKAQFANPKHLLWPGAFARVALELGTQKNAVVLPVGAVQTGPAGQFVYLVQADLTVKPQPIKLERVMTQDGKQFAVISGLDANQKVVLEGGQNLRPGAKIAEGKAPSGDKPKADSATKP